MARSLLLSRSQAIGGMQLAEDDPERRGIETGGKGGGG